MHETDIRAIVAEALAEQQRCTWRYRYRRAEGRRSDPDIVWDRGGGSQGARGGFQHLRRWRKSVEQAQSYTFRAVITVLVTGLVGAAWLGVKVMLGK